MFTVTQPDPIYQATEECKLETTVSNMCLKWVDEEFALIPDDIDIKDSVIFNLCTLNLFDIDNEEVYNRLLDLLDENKYKQLTSLRLKYLYASMVTIFGIEYINLERNKFVQILLDYDIGEARINSLLNKHPHVVLLFHIQLAAVDKIKQVKLS